MKTVTILLMFFSVTSLLGQVAEESSISDIVQIELDNEINNQRSDVIIFKGNNNTVVLRQQGVNQLNAYIRGNDNNLSLVQSGDFSLIKTSQRGNSNSINSTVNGSYTTVNIAQKGNGNVFQQDLDNVNYGQLNFTQNGNSLHLTHLGNNKAAEGLEVRMTGNKMTILIESNN